jgi:hypothetical protein
MTSSTSTVPITTTRSHGTCSRPTTRPAGTWSPPASSPRFAASGPSSGGHASNTCSTPRSPRSSNAKTSRSWARPAVTRGVAAHGAYGGGSSCTGALLVTGVNLCTNRGNALFRRSRMLLIVSPLYPGNHRHQTRPRSPHPSGIRRERKQEGQGQHAGSEQYLHMLGAVVEAR